MIVGHRDVDDRRVDDDHRHPEGDERHRHPAPTVPDGLSGSIAAGVVTGQDPRRYQIEGRLRRPASAPSVSLDDHRSETRLLWFERGSGFQCVAVSGGRR